VASWRHRGLDGEPAYVQNDGSSTYVASSSKGPHHMLGRCRKIRVGVGIALTSFWFAGLPHQGQCHEEFTDMFPTPAPKLQRSVRHGSLIAHATQPYVYAVGYSYCTVTLMPLQFSNANGNSNGCAHSSSGLPIFSLSSQKQMGMGGT
jgi:hypothetical protein